MGKVLSQEEIDALLNDAKKGKDLDALGKEKKVIEYLYDWKNPAKINTEHKRQLKQIFQIAKWLHITPVALYFLSGLLISERSSVMDVEEIDYCVGDNVPTTLMEGMKR